MGLSFTLAVRYASRMPAFMRIILQDCDSDHYLTDSGEWTDDARNAKAFKSIGTAVDGARKVQRELAKSDLQIVLKFEKSDLDVELPVLGSDCE